MTVIAWLGSLSCKNVHIASGKVITDELRWHSARDKPVVCRLMEKPLLAGLEVPWFWREIYIYM